MTAVDQFGHKAVYNGSVAFASSDPYANLPTGYLTLSNGSASTSVTLYTPAVRSVTAIDSSNPSITGSLNVNVFGGTRQPATLSSEYAVGNGSGPDVTLYTSAGTAITTLYPFGTRYTSGVRTAVADFTLSGHPEIAVGTGPGVTAEVKVIDLNTGAVLFDVMPFGTFTGGVFVSEGDIKGDGYPDLIITPDQGGGPRVEIYHGGDFQLIANFYGINDPNFRGGCRASSGDINGDGYDDLVVSAGFNGGPRISVYDGKSLAQGKIVNMVGDFYAFTDQLRNGAYVAVGDVNGDGQADLIFGAGPGGSPETLILNGATLLTAGATIAITNPITNIFSGPVSSRDGVVVTAKNIDGDKYVDVVTGVIGSSINVYQGSTLISGGILPEYSIDVNSGVYVG